VGGLHQEGKEDRRSLHGFRHLGQRQDWEIKNLKIEPLKSDAKTAGVLASFDNFDRHEDINFSLIKDKKGWMVDDISTGCDMLSDVLKGKISTC